MSHKESLEKMEIYIGLSSAAESLIPNIQDSSLGASLTSWLGYLRFLPAISEDRCKHALELLLGLRAHPPSVTIPSDYL